MASSNKIQPIPRQDVHRISSGAVILDLATAVKELVENAVDAGATSVEVRLKDHGTELIEVADNGSGVKRRDRPALALKHHTSKLRSLLDLDRGPSSFGFRGEALSSLCAVAAEVAIVTRCDDDDGDGDDDGDANAEKGRGGGGEAERGEGARLAFDRAGALASSAPAPRARGTTVSVRRLFEPLPVRRRELLRAARREGARVVSVLQGYAVAVPKLRLVASDQRGSGARAALLQSPGGHSATARTAAAALWGPRVAASLVEVDAVILGGGEEEGAGRGEAAAAAPGSTPSSPRPPHSSPSARAREEAEGYFAPRVVGLVSSASASDKAGPGGSSERQFFSVNGRPVDLPRAQRVLLECWRALGSPLTSSSKPVAILDLRLPPKWSDVNVTPDKRRALLRRESALLEGLRAALRAAWEPSRATFQLHGPGSSTPAFAASKKKNPAASEAAAATSASAAKAAVAAFAAGGGSAREMIMAAAAGAKRAREAREEEEEEEGSEGDDDESEKAGEEEEAEAEEEEEAEPGPSVPQRPRVSAPPTAPSFAAFALGAAKPAAKPAAAAPAAAPSDGEDEEEEDEVEMEVEDEEKEEEAPPPPPLSAVAPAAAAAEAADEDATDLSGEEKEEAAAEAEEEEEEEEEGRDDDDALPASSPSPPPPAAVAASAPLPPLPPPPPETVLSVDMTALRAACARKRALVAERAKEQQRRRRKEAAEAEAAVAAEQKELRLEGFSSSSRRFAAASLAAAAAAVEEGGEKEDAAAAAPTDDLRDGDDGSEAAALAALADAPARAELERVFRRAEFSALSRRVVGQFNLGFVVARLGSDLFVVDQHASDEKATFERLCSDAGTLLSRQPLLAPVPLDLAPDEAAAVREHAGVFRANGFEIVEVDSSSSSSVASSANSCGLALVAVPHSRGDVFGARDVADLAARLSGGGGGAGSFGSVGADARFAADDAGARVGGGGEKNKTSSRPLPRPPRVRAMLAMRACRSSIMVGRTLTRSEMRRVVGALAGLQSPWNCPHGRPTMRHLAVLPPVGGFAPVSSAAAAASE